MNPPLASRVSLASTSYMLPAVALVLYLPLMLLHAQQPQQPVDSCSKIVSVSKDKEVTLRLQVFCQAVVNASKGQPYTPEYAQQLILDKQVLTAWRNLRPSQQDGLKRAYAASQLQAAAVANSAARLNSAVSATTQNRPDQQTTAPQTAIAGTSLVQKAAGPELLSLALESGSLTQTVSGNTATISGNLEGTVYTLFGLDPICFEKCGWMRGVLGDVNASATFTLDQQSTTTTTSTSPASGSSPPAGTPITVPSNVGKLSGITAKFRIHNKFDPRSSEFRNNWDAAVAKDTAYSSLADALMKANGKVSSAIFKAEDSGLVSEGAALIADILPAPPAGQPQLQSMAGDYDSYVKKTYNSANIEAQDLSTYLQTYAQLTADWQTIRDNGIGTLATIQYAFAKPTNQPETHIITGIVSYAPKNSTANGLFTANFGVSIYGGTIPAGSNYGRLQYGQASAEFQRILFSPASTGPINLDIAGYWQYQPNPSVLNITQSNLAPGTTIQAPTQVLVGTSGSLWVAQAQLQYKNNSGLSIPFGVKWSNKTQLLTGNKVGAQIGISYDFSFLSNALNPSK